MTILTDRIDYLLKNLPDKEYRTEYVNSYVDNSLASQIRLLRKSREWTQTKLASVLETEQPTVSMWEDPDYGRHSLDTLKKLAEAFDVALIVKFAPFSELVAQTLDVTPEKLTPSSFDAEIQKDFIGNVLSSSFVIRENPEPPAMASVFTVANSGTTLYYDNGGAITVGYYDIARTNMGTSQSLITGGATITYTAAAGISVGSADTNWITNTTPARIIAGDKELALAA